MPLLLVGGCTGAEGTWCDGYGLWTGSSSGGSTYQKFRLVSSVFSAESRVDIHATSVRCASLALMLIAEGKGGKATLKPSTIEL